MDWSKRVEELREAQTSFATNSRTDRESAKSWWYLEGFIDVLRGKGEWEGWSRYKKHEADAYETYLQGRTDALGELDVL